MAQHRQYGLASVILVAVIWGLSFVAARIVLSTLTPILLATVRFSLASLMFIPIMLRELRGANAPKIRDLMQLAFLGFLGISIYFFLQYTGVKYAGAGISALLVVGLIPILTGVASVVVLKEGYGVRQMLGTGLGILGVALITVPGLFLEKVDVSFYVGVVCLFLNAVCWALYSTLSRRLMGRTGKPLIVTAYITIFGTLMLLPMAAWSDWSLINSLQTEQWLSILYLSLVCSCAGYFLWNFALSKMEALKASVWLYLEPVAAFVGEMLIYKIIPSLVTLLGGAAIIVGALLTSWPREISGSNVKN